MMVVWSEMMLVDMKAMKLVVWLGLHMADMLVVMMVEGLDENWVVSTVARLAD
jgi:hypothetical protein